jgi:hypothetical protein
MKSAISIDVAAPAEVVFALARDVERWPRLLAHYVGRADSRTAADGSVVARMIADARCSDCSASACRCLAVADMERAQGVSDPFVHQGGRDERDGLSRGGSSRP